MSAKKVLVVDDDRNNLELMSEYLDDLGIEAVLANGGKEGVRLARSEKPDAILLDVMMPDMPGEEVAAALKEDAETSGIPVVFLTSLAEPEDTEKGVIGGYKFISKQLPPKELIEQLKKLLS